MGTFNATVVKRNMRNISLIRISSAVKLVVGFLVMGLVFAILAIILIILLPSQTARIRTCNHFGKVVGRFFVWLSGCPFTVVGREHLDPRRPAIYVSNHTSVLDIFIAIWHAPVGTSGVAKKQIIYYPFFGLLYALSGHLRINRGISKKAVASMKNLAENVNKHGLSIFLWPEGTRSRTGRLLPFKKGMVHLAVQTGLPVVPVIVTGAYKSWEARTYSIHKVPIRLDVLPPIDTSQWSIDLIDDAIEEVHARFREVLPADQQPTEEAS